MMWMLIPIVIIILLGLFVFTYNGLVKRRNRVKNAWSQIDVQLKRRFDLVPNLVETVKGYAKHEKETLEDIVKARNSYISASGTEDAIKANNEITGALNRLFALAESYPDLKANENYIQLQSDLTNAENKIGYSRQFYNDSVLIYNNFRQVFPNNIISSIFNFKDEPYFQVEETERENIKVRF